MTSEPVARSSEPTEADRENRTLALELIRNSNEIVTSFAKQMVTTSLSSVGVILALAKFRGLEDQVDVWVRIALAIACGGCLAAALVFAFALKGRRISVSLDDFAEAPYQLLTIAHRRERLTTFGLVLLAASIISATLLLTLL